MRLLPKSWSLILLGLALPGAAENVVEIEPGHSVERHLKTHQPLSRWMHDPELWESEIGDHLEQREVVVDDVEVIKHSGLVPPIRFESGVADIPASHVDTLRQILEEMEDLPNVRLHLVGHADDQPLSPQLAMIYGDNQGLSRERAGEVAELLQRSLSLPPDAISFEWAGDRQPIASNASAAGRALNRRVEVEVWHDRVGEKVAVEEVLVPEEFKRIKVCRMETVCKLRYRDGHALRARVENLVPTHPVGPDTVGVSEEFVRQVEEALHNLRDKHNVTAKFIGYTDDRPLRGREAEIYGTHLALSKARARRVALAVREALDLPSAAVESDGHGAARPLASNHTLQGRVLNRRVEVEFWHDDPLQELPDEPQPCPDAAAAEIVTKVYDPPWGSLAPLEIREGEAVIPAGYADTLRRAMADVSGKTNIRLRFVGYTQNERLDRRTALVYGDDIGLATARARRTMETLKAELDLSNEQAEHEGRGYVHSNDVVNTGFLQGDGSYVAVEVVYDELSLVDEVEGVDVTPITRELSPQDPLALNLMRITVDGEPLDDPGRSSADVQRCTDVALERADIRFRFDNLQSEPRLSVSAYPRSVTLASPGGTGAAASSVRFRMYTNYGHFIERSEIRLFDRGASLRSDPLAVVEVGPADLARWQPPATWFEGPVRELVYVLRVYDAEGRFDETRPQELWMVLDDASPGDLETADAREGEEEPVELLAEYGESGLALRNIPLGNTGTVYVQGNRIPPGHTVWFAGKPIPVDHDRRFVAEAILPPGMHTVEIAVLDPKGNGQLFLRDLELEQSEWFYVGVADLTFSATKTSGPADALEGDNAPFDRDSFADGRLAFYVSGKFKEDWQLQASADTREGPLEEIFTNFLDKSPESLFRRIDPDYHYPTFGDDSRVEEMTPTSGRFFVKLNRRESHALWGNFKVGYFNNELAQVDRGLYGANLRYESDGSTEFGEKRLVLDGFAAEPGTVASREEFRGTGGSLYFLRRQDLLSGSDRVRIEVRDKDSGIVSGVVHLQPVLDYDIDYLQGRVLLSEPLSPVVNDSLLVRTGGLSGDEAWLVVQYEYTAGFDEPDALAAGGQGHVWLTDSVKLGLTAGRSEDDNADGDLYGADLTLRKSAASWLKLQAGRSEGQTLVPLRSNDGGFDFLGTAAPLADPVDSEALGYRADLSLGFEDVVDSAKGRVSLYGQQLDQGYSAPGQIALNDTLQYGGRVGIPVTDHLALDAKADRLVETDGLETTTGEVDLLYQISERWKLSSGARTDHREDRSPIPSVSQQEGARTDAALQLGYDPRSTWNVYGFGQGTVAKSGDRDDNHRGGVGGAYRISDRLRLDGEVSHGNQGPGALVGTTFQKTDRTNLYLNYALENERTDNGLSAGGGTLVTGARSRLSDSASVHTESRYQHARTTGLTHAAGMTLRPADPWNLGADWESGTLVDRRTRAEIERRAAGLRLGYAFEKIQLSSTVEYRFDETENPDGSTPDRTTWLFRNDLKLELNPDWRLLGRFNRSISDSSLGSFHDGGYTEAVLGYAYRPLSHDRLNALAKYTFFFNVPTTDQVGTLGTPDQFVQKSHIGSLDLTYEVTPKLSLGGKFAYRLGEVSLDRENPEFFDNTARLYLLRSSWRFFGDWEASAEARMLELPDIDERRGGALVSLYRYIGDHLKVGVGWNFTDFSDDLTNLSYDEHGFFFNLVGTL